MTRQGEEVRHLARLVADRADRAGGKPLRLGSEDQRAEQNPGIEGGVEEGVEMIVGEGVAAQRVDRPLPGVVGADDEQDGRPLYPGVAGKPRLDRGALRRIGDKDDVGLLQVGLRRSGEDGGADEPHQGGIDRLRPEAPVRGTSGKPGEGDEPLLRHPLGHRDRLAEAHGALGRKPLPKRRHSLRHAASPCPQEGDARAPRRGWQA